MNSSIAGGNRFNVALRGLANGLSFKVIGGALETEPRSLSVNISGNSFITA